MRRFIPLIPKPPTVPVLHLRGAIGAGSGRGLSDQGLAPLIERAFSRGKPAAVALVINSPGGSAVQSSLIAARIRRLADEKGIPVHAFVEDVAASGGYWLACAADDIHVDASSMLGSIGVIFASFGFQELMARHGIERRVHTAGKSKSFADPFRAEKPKDVARIRALLGPLHDNFIAHVKARRGARLDPKAELFEADVWLGQQAVELGLADGIGHCAVRLKELYGDKVRLVPLLQRPPLAQRFGLMLGTSAIEGVQERALWARYGL